MKNSVKIAVITCGMFGGLSFNPSDDLGYLEDDDLFTKTTATLLNGWEWGNYAKATETLYIVGSRPPPLDPSLPGGYDPHDGGYGGYDNSEYNSPEDDAKLTPTEIAACEARTERLVDNCKSTYSQFNAGVGTLCTTVAFSGTVVGVAGATFCSSSVAFLDSEADQWCTLQGAHKKARDCTE